MKAYIAPLITVVTLLLLMPAFNYFAPEIVKTAMIVSFCFSLLKALTVLAVARLALTYLDNRLGVNVNEFFKNACDKHKATYFSARFSSVFVVFGFIMA
jgi:hypothetical protein